MTEKEVYQYIQELGDASVRQALWLVWRETRKWRNLGAFKTMTWEISSAFIFAARSSGILQSIGLPMEVEEEGIGGA